MFPGDNSPPFSEFSDFLLLNTPVPFQKAAILEADVQL